MQTTGDDGAVGPQQMPTTLNEPLIKLLILTAYLHATTSGCGQEATSSCCSNIAAARAIAEAATAADVVKGASATWLNNASGGAAVVAPISVSQTDGHSFETVGGPRAPAASAPAARSRRRPRCEPHRLPASREMLLIAARPTASRRLLRQAINAAHAASDGARA